MHTNRTNWARAPWPTRLGVTGGVLGLLLTTAACGGDSGGGGGGAAADGGTTREDGPVSMRMSWWGSDTRHAATQELIDLYESENEGVTIEGDFTGFADYWDRLATGTAGGQAPCVMQQDTRYVREYADRNALLDLTPYIEDGTIDTSNLDENVAETGMVEDATYAIPTGVNAFSLVVDPQAYAAAGVELPDDSSWTWDEMVETAAQVTSATGGQVYGMQAMGLNGGDTNFEVYAREQGEALFDENGEIGFTQETLAEWWNIEKQASETGAEPPPSTTVEVFNGGVDQALVATGRGASGFWWTNELPALTAGAGTELQFMRFPTEAGDGETGMYLKPAMFWAVSSSCESPQEAAMLVDWLINSEDAVEIIKADRGLPVNTELRDQIAPTLDPAGQAAVSFVEEITPELQDPPALPPQGAGEVQAILQRYTEQILFDQISVEDAAEQFMSEVESAIA
ncbi:extracellular solute-binding protein [Modestobacter sp. VKM Ac-2979]|uniref:ABC transporter substrate-binding protein n=1 Tax=unclassified Modestobacter TaxID=2643866 RepID=UPI0022AB7127|nr:MULTISPECIES: extracellular solute-binding protein [unclassified Modestobacter]MCZ2810734.1 extracellular solute-binding protein [Modestobacter sp. VKM Ac-2979]MCZ2840247.1 extracellular solute-binding protein [Modestobacter sp. VKM Ac-2980]